VSGGPPTVGDVEDGGRGARLLGIALLLSLLVAGVYGQTASHPYINLDDPDYVSENGRVLGGLSAGNVAWAFSTFHAANWHPLTWLSHMADVSLFGAAPGPQHLVNAVLHLANVLLLFFGLSRMTGALWRSAFAAALFAVHPLNVESVAWIAERKNLLSTLFLLLAIGAYARYAADRSIRRYATVALLFALALMCKPMPVTLPLLLLLLDIWPLGRLDARSGQVAGAGAARSRLIRLAAEKLPLLALSAASAAVTLIGQSKGGALRSLEVVPAGLRISNAVVSGAEYLAKAVWPHPLALFYPLPPVIPAWKVAVAAILLGGLTILSVRARRSYPCLLTGWLWYLVSMSPVIGLVQVGNAAMADRYAYVPTIGLFVAVSWLAGDAVRGRRALRVAAAVAGGAAIVFFSTFAWRQAALWGDGERLYANTLSVIRENWLVMNNHGTLYEARGDHARAIDCFRAVVRIHPRYAPGWNNLGMATDAQGNTREAMGFYREALRLDPGSAEAWNNLAVASNGLGLVAAAIEDLREAIRLRSNYPDAWFNLGVAYARLGRHVDAVSCYREALRLRPGHEKSRAALAREMAR
jgi:protein O-mannosyl-transferase